MPVTKYTQLERCDTQGKIRKPITSVFVIVMIVYEGLGSLWHTENKVFTKNKNTPQKKLGRYNKLKKLITYVLSWNKEMSQNFY